MFYISSNFVLNMTFNHSIFKSITYIQPPPRVYPQSFKPYFSLSTHQTEELPLISFDIEEFLNSTYTLPQPSTTCFSYTPTPQNTIQHSIHQYLYNLGYLIKHRTPDVINTYFNTIYDKNPQAFNHIYPEFCIQFFLELLNLHTAKPLPSKIDISQPYTIIHDYTLASLRLLMSLSQKPLFHNLSSDFSNITKPPSSQLLKTQKRPVKTLKSSRTSTTKS
jgi:hypothetical protein